MEAVSGIEHLRAVLARLSCGQPPQHSADRRIAVDNVVAALVNDLFELLVGSEILRRKRRPLERHIKDPLHKVQLQAILLGKVVPRCHMDFTAVLMQHSNKRLVELADMRLYGGNK